MKTIRVIEFPNGFVNPIKVYQGPSGGAYLLEEVAHMVPENQRGEVSLTIYEIKATRVIQVSDLFKENQVTTISKTFLCPYCNFKGEKYTVEDDVTTLCPKCHEVMVSIFDKNEGEQEDVGRTTKARKSTRGKSRRSTR